MNWWWSSWLVSSPEVQGAESPNRKWFYMSTLKLFWSPNSLVSHIIWSWLKIWTIWTNQLSNIGPTKYKKIYCIFRFIQSFRYCSLFFLFNFIYHSLLIFLVSYPSSFLQIQAVSDQNSHPAKLSSLLSIWRSPSDQNSLLLNNLFLGSHHSLSRNIWSKLVPDQNYPP